MEIWFYPEVERLRQLGLVKEDYRPERCKLFFSQWQQKRPFWKECDLNRRAKVNSNYIDCAYLTFKNVNRKWEWYFDFRHNKGKAEKLFNIHLQFFETAMCAYNAGRLQVFVDFPLSSTELFVRSWLFVMSEQKFMQISQTTRWIWANSASSQN